MKILMLSWEYPPKSVGGLSNHVYYLAQSLKKAGNEVHIVTCQEGEIPNEEQDNGVYVHRVAPYNLETEDFTKWVMHLNFAMIERTVQLINKLGEFDIIHAHDWLSAYSAKVLKWSCKIPMLCTIHATEHGRNGGIRTDMQRYISSAEWMLTYEAWKVIVCSEYMKSEVCNIFNTPDDKINVVPNGIDSDSFKLDFDRDEFRRRYAKDEEKLVFYVGRHVHEKGVQLLIETAPDILNTVGEVKFVIAGKGPMTEELKEKAKYLGLENRIIFTGYMDDADKVKFYKIADTAVFPSFYEPFGIVTLEAMAAGCPVVVSDIGGLKEIVEHKINGIKFITGSRDSLKDNIVELLSSDNLRKDITEKAYEALLEKYTWNKVAEETIKVYKKVQLEAKGTEWEIKAKKKTTGTRRKKAESDIEKKEESVEEPITKQKGRRKKVSSII